MTSRSSAAGTADDRPMRTARTSSIAATRSAPNLRCHLRRAVRPACSTRVLLVLTAGALPGCAGGHASPPTTATVAVTQASALAFAQTVNLRAGDEPEMKALGAEGPDPSLHASDVAFARCAGLISPESDLINIRSAWLSTRGARELRLLRSRVAVLPSEALARRNLAAFSSPRGLRCAHHPGTSISKLSIALPGGVHATGERVIAPEEGPPHELGYHDIVRFVYGPAEIALTAAGYTHPVPTQTEQHLLGVLYRRATEARGEL
jgi:hypothetical protein